MKTLGYVLVVMVGFMSWAVHASDSGWKHQSELGTVLTGGNTATLTINGKQDTSVTWSRNKFRLRGGLVFGSANDVILTRQWTTDIRYERRLSGLLSVYLANLWESDTFAGFDYRVSVEPGVKIDLIQKERLQFTGEASYRFTDEEKVAGQIPDSLISQFGRLYLEVNRQWSTTFSTQLWAEFLYDFANSTNIVLNFEPSMEVQMISHLSLKIAYLGRFDNLPAIPGIKKFDYTTVTALVAKF